MAHSSASAVSTMPAVFVDTTALPSQTSDAFQPVTWKTLFGSPGSSTTGITQGICRIPPQKALKRHHHAHAETYYVLEGQALMEAGAVANPSSAAEGDSGAKEVTWTAPKRIKAGDAIYLPGNCPHRTFNDSTDRDLVFLYTFAADQWTDVHYCYLE
ncbi:hypothetical protein HDU93_008269 [Gonapodya sp. JEL0774]|nr:hypothetical protein HDU93_008269 [Gonapodya sp. JEL0774]